ncbi:MAG TPA: hypothetical protein VGF17_03045, partial [Phytomonospora sp.]
AVVGTLLGTVVGALGAVMAQHLAVRAAERRDDRHHRAAMRFERKAAIDLFVEVAQEVERVAGSHGVEERSIAGQRLWVAHKQLALICSDDLEAALSALADKLNEVLWGDLRGTPVWEFTRAETNAFRAAARAELERFTVV